MREFKMSRTKSGIPCIWELKKMNRSTKERITRCISYPDGGKKTGVFFAKNGHSKNGQALIPVKRGDVICEIVSIKDDIQSIDIYEINGVNVITETFDTLMIDTMREWNDDANDYEELIKATIEKLYSKESKSFYSKLPKDWNADEIKSI